MPSITPARATIIALVVLVIGLTAALAVTVHHVQHPSDSAVVTSYNDGYTNGMTNAYDSGPTATQAWITAP